MQEAGIDLLLTSTPESINYLSGYEGWSFFVTQVLLLAIDEEEPVLILRNQDVNCASITAFINSENIQSYPNELNEAVNTHPMQFIAKFIERKGWGKQAIGIEKNSDFLSVRSYQLLRESLPNSHIVDASLLVNWIRTVKSAAEIVLMREAARLAECAMQAAVDTIEVGIRECDAVAALYRAHLRGTAEYGGSVPNSVLMMTGAKTKAPHLKWSDEPFSLGDTVAIELSGSRRQYHCALARTVILGEIPEPLTNLLSIVKEGMHAALAAVRPGELCEDINSAWKSVIESAGLRKSSRIGYAQGICFQPTWVERTASLQAGDKTVLEPNMTFHMILGMWQGEHKLTFSESFLVTKNGHELLTHFPQIIFNK